MTPEEVNPQEKQPRRDTHPTPGQEALEAYNTVADTVGGVPSLRWKDNVIQGVAILATVMVGTLAGFLVTFDLIGAGIGAFAGLVGGLLVSGVVLMVLGWVRTGKKIRRLARPGGNE
jgi:hypothetical protein